MDVYKENRSRAITVTSLSEYHEAIREIGFERPWFRGNRDTAWHLVPKAFRSTLPIAREGEQFVEFTRRAHSLVAHRPQTAWEWLFIAQHHGMPTRLLDWSESAMAGLFFALEERAEYANLKCDAGVWVLDPFQLNEAAGLGRTVVKMVGTQDGAEYLRPYTDGVEATKDVPLAVIPSYATPRIIAQRGTFTAFGKEEGKLEALSANEPPRQALLRLLRVPAIQMESMRRELDVAGITESVMYPDLAGLGAEIGRRFR